MNKKIGIIIGVVVAVVAIVLGVVFLTPDKDAGNVDYISDYIEKTDDWKTAGLSEYGIDDEVEFSEAFESSAGNVYLIRNMEYNTGDALSVSTTYIAVETDDKIWISQCDTEDGGYVPELAEGHDVKFADVDGEDGEEVLVTLMHHNHGAPGRGQYATMVWKICDNGIKEIFNGKDLDNGFEIQLAEEYTAIVKNSAFNYEKELDCYNDEGLFFDENGSPIPDSNYDSIHPVWEMDAKDVDGDNENELICKQWIYLSESTFHEHDAVTVLKYSSASEVFEVVDAYVQVSAKPSYVPFDEIIENGAKGNEVYDVVFDAYKDFETYDGFVCGYASYAFYDIDKNGTDELIIETSTCEADRLYHFYTFDGERIVDVGQINGWHTTLSAKDGRVEAATGHSMGFMYTVYEFTGESLVQILYEEYEYDDDEGSDIEFGTEIEFTYYME